MIAYVKWVLKGDCRDAFLDREAQVGTEIFSEQRWNGQDSGSDWMSIDQILISSPSRGVHQPQQAAGDLGVPQGVPGGIVDQSSPGLPRISTFQLVPNGGNRLADTADLPNQNSTLIELLFWIFEVSRKECLKMYARFLYKKSEEKV